VIAPKAKFTSKERVRKLQRTLYRAAKASPERTFGVLYDKVWRQDVLMEATRRVVSNRGGPGVDEQTVAELKISTGWNVSLLKRRKSCERSGTGPIRS
jgi:hypothetical protein